ncbi:MAG: hypothetical protein ACFFCS_20975 [Candidatus Hodarchaeota archaeon]
MVKETCKLCGKSIADYSKVLNCLEIDEFHAIDICQECIDKFLKWQQGIFARLFPTSSMKKMLEKRGK